MSENKEKEEAPAEQVFTIGYWLPIKSQTETDEQSKLAIWRWDKGRVDMTNLSWYITVTAKSAVEAVAKGQQIRIEQLQKKNSEAA